MTLFSFSFDPFAKKHDGPRDRRDKDKLLHKMKREKKSAKKELRKDTAFLAKQKAVEIRERQVTLMFDNLMFHFILINVTQRVFNESVLHCHFQVRGHHK